MATLKRLNGTLCENVLTLLCYSEEHGRIVANSVETELFEGDFKIIAEKAVDYWRKYGIPPKEHTADLVSKELEDPKSSQTFRRILMLLHEMADSVNSKYVMDELNTFTRMQRLKDAIVKSAESINARQEMAIEEIETIWNDILRAREKDYHLGMKLTEIHRMLKYFEENEQEFKTGIKELDIRNVNPSRGKVMLFLAAAGKGKCIAEGEPVLLSDGRYIPIEEVRDGNSVMSFDALNGTFKSSRARISFNGVKSSFCVTTRTGREISITSGHPLLTKRGWMPLSQLCIGDEIAVPAKLPCFGMLHSDMKTMRVLGYLIADGGLTKPSSPTFTKKDMQVLEDMKECLLQFGCKLTPAKNQPDNYYITNEGSSGENKICTLLKLHGLLGKKSNQKTIPKFIFTLRKEYVAEFLSAIFTCDGSVFQSGSVKKVTRGVGFDYSTTNHAMAKQISHLLTRFGIVSKLRHRTQIVSKQQYHSWSVTICDRDNMRLLEKEIGLLFGKGKKLRELLNHHYDHKRNTNSLSKRVFGNLLYDQIKEIKPIGKKRTYDLTVNDTHNFVAGNILVHNSWFLVNAAKQALMLRKRVLYISLEMSEEEIAQRLYQSIFSAPTRHYDDEVTIREMDFEKDRLVGFHTETVIPDFTLDSPTVREELESRVMSSVPQFENLQIIRFSPRSVNISDIESYLDNLEIIEHFIPDLVILDYIGRIKTNLKEHRLSLGNEFELFRGLMIKRNMAGLTAHQVSRAGAKAHEVRVIHAAEDWSLIMTSDIAVTYSCTEAEFEVGLARLYVEKARSEKDHFSVLITQNYTLGQFALNSTLMTRKYKDLLKEITGEKDDDESQEDEDADD